RQKQNSATGFACGNAPPVQAPATFRLFRSFWTKFLRAPRHHFGCKDRTVLIDCERMRVEMPSSVRCWSLQHGDDFSVVADFQNLTSNCVGHVDKVIRCDKEAEGMTEFPFAKVPALEIENLDAPIFAVAHINQITIDCD